MNERMTLEIGQVRRVAMFQAACVVRAIRREGVVADVEVLTGPRRHELVRGVPAVDVLDSPLLARTLEEWKASHPS